MHRPRQRGVALITALLVTAIAALIAAQMASRQRLDIHRSANLLARDQAWLFARGVETWAAEILARDARSGKTDSLGEDWAVALPPLTVEGAIVSGHIEDLQARININNLLRDGKPSRPDVDRFRRLLRNHDGDESLVEAVLDWLDEDENPHLPAGAEDTAYLLHDPAYRAANRLMSSPSELRLVDGFDAALVGTIEPWIQTLPERTPINVNTAPAEVLMTLTDRLEASDVEDIIEERGDQGFADVKSFMALPQLKHINLSADNISVASHYFLLMAEIRLDEARLQLHSVLARDDDGHVKVMMRSFGGY